MNAYGSFKWMDNKIYEAISIPTENGGSFIIALPKDKIALSKVEAAIVKTGRTLATFVETMLNSTLQENLHVTVPRLSLQIIHEWSTPSNRVCAP